MLNHNIFHSFSLLHSSSCNFLTLQVALIASYSTIVLYSRDNEGVVHEEESKIILRNPSRPLDSIGQVKANPNVSSERPKILDKVLQNLKKVYFSELPTALLPDVFSQA